MGLVANRIECSPPTYAECDQGPFANDPVTGTQHLELTNLDHTGDTPNVDQTLVHLKLLHAIYNLRISVSATDGLYDLYDADVTDTLSRGQTAAQDTSQVAHLENALLAKLKEKRWAIFVSRAAKRFEAWWMQFKARRNGSTLSEASFQDLASKADINSWASRAVWQISDLPPLDVLMVWHAFMLNPRCFLEDCLRLELMDLWRCGMPWAAVNASIDVVTEEYEPGAEAHAKFEAQSNMSWSSFNDPNEISINCYRCPVSVAVRLFTTSRLEIVAWAAAAIKHSSPQIFPSGSGWADSGFFASCSQCSQSITHKQRQAGRFANDVLLRKHQTCLMPGTILPHTQGTVTPLMDNDPRHFPNKLVEHLESGYPRGSEYIKMEQVRHELNIHLRTKSNINSRYKKRELPAARSYVRSMLLRYQDNSSSFALDLVGAVIRQGTFIDKMQNIDWLHSPTAQITMARLLKKYGRFFEMLRDRPSELTVPTLDVDLAWHTNQLSPSSYYEFSTRICRGRFVDHDDKIPEAKLSVAFKKTSRYYEERFQEPYSECVCWYCEAIRASQYSRLSRMFNRTTTDAVDAALYNSAKSAPLPTDPQQGPHISAHSAVHALPTQPGQSATKHDAELAETQAHLLAAFKAACRRAKRRGRAPPPLPALLDDKRRGHERAMIFGAAGGVALGAALIVPFLAAPCDDSFFAANPTAQAEATCAAGTCSGAACSAITTGTCDIGGCGGDGGCGGGCGGCG